MSNVSKRKKLAITIAVCCLVVFVGFGGICLLAWAQAGQLQAHGVRTMATVTNYSPSPTGVKTPSTVTVQFTPRGSSQEVSATANDDSNQAPAKTVAIVYDSQDPASFTLVGQNPQSADVGLGTLVGALAFGDLAIIAFISRMNF